MRGGCHGTCSEPNFKALVSSKELLAVAPAPASTSFSTFRDQVAVAFVAFLFLLLLIVVVVAVMCFLTGALDFSMLLQAPVRVG